MFTSLSITKRLVIFLGFVLFFGALFYPAVSRGEEKAYYHLALIADPHLPGKDISAKEAVIKTINSWNDVDAVAVLGDICYEFGTEAEYDFAKRFFGGLAKPTYFITGNHDYYYEDFRNVAGRFTRALSDKQEKKLKTFRETFNQPELYYSRTIGDYFLIFLSLDELGSSDLARLSQTQIEWLRAELSGHRSLPTIIFCHAPLKGTLWNVNRLVNTPNFVIQPENVIKDLIVQNPQVFLWVSGHTHTCPNNSSFASDINLYEKRVMNIHNCDMNHIGTFWTRSLLFYPDRVIVKTFDHTKGQWVDDLQRTVSLSPDLILSEKNSKKGFSTP